MCKLAKALVSHGQLMNIATFLPWDLREQDRKPYLCRWLTDEQRIGDTANIFSQTSSCFLVNFVNKGDSQKLSSTDDSQYTAVYNNINIFIGVLNTWQPILLLYCNKHCS